MSRWLRSRTPFIPRPPRKAAGRLRNPEPPEEAAPLRNRATAYADTWVI